MVFLGQNSTISNMFWTSLIRNPVSGICMRQKSAFDRDALHFAPFLLFPSPFPRREFHLAVDIQPTLQELMHKVAHDYDFLRETLAETIKVDEFTAKLFEIYEMTRKEGVSQVRFGFGWMQWGVQPEGHIPFVDLWTIYLDIVSRLWWVVYSRTRIIRSRPISSLPGL